MGNLKYTKLLLEYKEYYNITLGESNSIMAEVADRKLTYIITELKHHAPFTLCGALFGVVFMLLLRYLPVSDRIGHVLFDIFHPGHVLLSAMTTAAMFKLHSRKPRFLTVLIIGYVGSIGIATLSDCVIPYIGEFLLGFHAGAHGHQGHGAHWLHFGFIERWYLVNPLAIAGALIAYFRPTTRFPHAGHVLLSVWASLSHILIAMGVHVSIWQWLGVVGFLFLAVWLPCCISDIVFPLLFVKPTDELPRHAH